MKMRLILPAIFGAAALCASCNSAQDILDDYNSRFIKVPVLETDNFDETKAAAMLSDLYKVSVENMFILMAPSGCDEYRWRITDLGGKMARIGEQRGQMFRVYLPTTDLYAAVYRAEGKSRLYEVTLTVRIGGKSYSDSAVLVLYGTE